MKINISSASIGLGMLVLAGSANALTFNEVENGQAFTRYFSVTPTGLSIGGDAGSSSLVITVSGLKSQFSALSFEFIGVPGLAVNATSSATDPTRVWSAAFSDPRKPLDLTVGTAYQVKVSGMTYNLPSQEGTVSLSVTNALVTPVPEPESYAMLLAGLGLMGTIARRRRQAK